MSIVSVYSLEDIVSESLGKAPASEHEALPSVDQAEANEDDYSHMEGFANICLEKEEVNKINMYRQKKSPPEIRHLKIKNVKFLNKAIRKMHMRKKIVICFTNVLKNLDDLQIQVHCDSGSISGIEKFKSQTGIMAVITSKEAIKKTN